MELCENYLRLIVAEKYKDLWDHDRGLPIWGRLLDDAKAHPLALKIIDSDSSLLQYLELFFSPTLVQSIAFNLEATKASLLGGEYSKRGVYLSFIRNIYPQIAEKCQENGQLRSGENGIDEKQGGPRQDVGGVHGSGGQGGCGHGFGFGRSEAKRNEHGARGRGRGRGDGRCFARRTMFEHLQVVPIHLSFRNSLDKIDSRGVGFNESILSRSKRFARHHLIYSNVGSHYDPEDGQDLKIDLYHGTRSSWYKQFCTHGISPSSRDNEFSKKEAFYVTNSIQVAFEHPLHNHWVKFSKLSEPDPVMIFRIRVRNLILHGQVGPGNGQRRFKVKWFERPDKEWHDFCLANYSRERLDEDDVYDIVIGPISRPAGESGKKTYEAVEIDGRNPQQVAFVSRRSRVWLEDRVKEIFQEVHEVRHESDSSSSSPWATV